MKVVIVGGAGFIGRNILQRFIGAGMDVCVYDRYQPDVAGDNFFKGIQYICGDLSDQKELLKIISKGDTVIHLLSTSYPNNSNINIYQDAYDNILPGVMLAEICVKKEAGRLIFASSGGAVYGQPCYVPVDENHPLNPVSSYGIHKLAIEKYLKLVYKLYGIRTVSLRISNPYGAWQRPFSGQGFIATALACAKMDRTVEIWGDGSATRDYVYIGDVAEAFYKALFYDGEYSVFNIGSGIGKSVNEILDEIQKIEGKSIKREYYPKPSAEVGKNVLDGSRAKEYLGWSPATGLNEGLQRMSAMWDSTRKIYIN